MADKKVEAVSYTICPQCDRCVTFCELEDHLLAHEIDNVTPQSNSGKKHSVNVFESRNGQEKNDIITEGIIPVLIRYYTRTKPPGVKSVSFSASTSHVNSTPSDFGWGCGYRNIQMMFSSLLTLEPYRSVLMKENVTGIPDIVKLQDMIEAAWSKGFDPKGCLELNGKVKLTKKWIGTTEAASILRMLRINAQVVDFAKPTGVGGTHPLLFEWIKNYFRTGRPALMDGLAAQSPNKDASATTINCSDYDDDMDYPPLYLQHEGHSRTVVGIEERVGGVEEVLLLDPSLTTEQMHRVLMNPKHYARLLKKTVDQFKEKEYEIVFIDGLLTDDKVYEGFKIISPYQRFPSN